MPDNIFRIDLSLNNPEIKAFFEGDGKAEAPVREFIYAHTHRINDNFLTDLEILILSAAEFSTTPLGKKKAGVYDKIKSLSDQYAKLINKVNAETAPEILEVLRQIYQLIMRILPSKEAK